MAPILAIILGLVLLEPLSCFAKTPRVISLPFHERKHHHPQHHLHTKRDTAGTLNSSLENYLPLFQYYVTVGIGTPSQVVELNLVSNGGDTFVFAPGVCHRTTNGSDQCLGNSFDPRLSDSYEQRYDLPPFRLKYDSGENYNGPLFQDTLTIGGMSAKKAIMGLATSSNGKGSVGSLALGFAQLEGCLYRKSQPCQEAYENVPQTMQAQGLIGTTSYSIYLDDLAASSGSLILGGYDTEKFAGDIVMFPVVENPFNGKPRDGWFIPWVGFGFSSDKGYADYSSPHDPWPLATLIDVGSTYSTIPYEFFSPLIDPLGLYQLDSGDLYFVNCDFPEKEGVEFNFRFLFGSATANAPPFEVPLLEMIRPAYNASGQPITDNHGRPYCVFGIQPMTNLDAFPTLGQTFLRSVYTLYNLDSAYLGLAQTVWGSESSNVIEYGGINDPKVRTDTEPVNPSSVNFLGHSYTLHRTDAPLKTSVTGSSVYTASSYPTNRPTSSFATTLSVADGAKATVTPGPKPTNPSNTKGHTQQNVSSSSGPNLIGVYVGVPVAVVVLAIVGVALFFVMRRRRRRREAQSYSSHGEPRADGATYRQSFGGAPPYEPFKTPAPTYTTFAYPHDKSSSVVYTGPEHGSPEISASPEMSYRAGIVSQTLEDPVELDVEREARELNAEPSTLIKSRSVPSAVSSPPLESPSLRAADDGAPETERPTIS